MNTYELMVILRGSLDEQTVQSRIEQLTKTVEQLGGVVDKVDHWGKRAFAYEIDHMTEGWYVVLDLQLDNSAQAEIDRQLRIADEIIRFKMIRPDLRRKRVS